MATPYVDIYRIFMNDIKGKEFISMLTPEQLGDVLEDYLLESADIHFKKCNKDLSDRDSDLQQFNVDLTSEEKRILAKGMKIKWLSSNFIANEKLFNTKLTTKDYKIFSPANQLKSLMSLDAENKRELKSLIIRYLYDNMIRGV